MSSAASRHVLVEFFSDAFDPGEPPIGVKIPVGPQSTYQHALEVSLRSLGLAKPSLDTSGWQLAARGSVFDDDIVFPNAATVAWNRFGDDVTFLPVMVGPRSTILARNQASKEKKVSPGPLSQSPIGSITFIPCWEPLPPSPPSAPKPPPEPAADTRWVLVDVLTQPPFELKLPILPAQTFEQLVQTLVKSIKGRKSEHARTDFSEWGVACQQSLFDSNLFFPNPSLLVWTRFNDERNPELLHLSFLPKSPSSSPTTKPEAIPFGSGSGSSYGSLSSGSSKNQSPHSPHSSLDASPRSSSPDGGGSGRRPKGSSSNTLRTLPISPENPSLLRKVGNLLTQRSSITLTTEFSPEESSSSSPAHLTEERRGSPGSWAEYDLEDLQDEIMAHSGDSLDSKLRRNSTGSLMFPSDDDFGNSSSSTSERDLSWNPPAPTFSVIPGAVGASASDDSLESPAVKGSSVFKRFRQAAEKGSRNKSRGGSAAALPATSTGQPDLPQLRTGSLFNPLLSTQVTLLRRLADNRGGSGCEIWLVSVSGWTCAMKTIGREIIGCNTLLQEITIYDHLPSHPFIVKHLGHSIDHTSINLYLELFDCQLEEFLNSQNSSRPASAEGLPPFLAVQFSWQCACAIAFLHKYFIVHRDIKCSNVFLRLRDGVPYLSAIGDFDTATNFKSTKLLSACGSTNYMAPEVLEVRASGPYTQRCDIFSLGMLIYHMIHGYQPFSGLSQLQVVNLTLGGVHPPASERVVLDPILSRLFDLAMACAAFEPEARLPLASLKVELEEFAKHHKIILGGAGR